MLLNISFILALAAAFFYLLGTLRAKELATAFARRECRAMQLQLLDQSVSLLKTRIKRTQNGQLNLVRTFQFEFTVIGEKRYKGSLELCRNQLIHIELEPHRIPDTNHDESMM